LCRCTEKPKNGCLKLLKVLVSNYVKVVKLLTEAVEKKVVKQFV